MLSHLRVVHLEPVTFVFSLFITRSFLLSLSFTIPWPYLGDLKIGFQLIILLIILINPSYCGVKLQQQHVSSSLEVPPSLWLSP